VKTSFDLVTRDNLSRAALAMPAVSPLTSHTQTHMHSTTTAPALLTLYFIDWQHSRCDCWEICRIQNHAAMFCENK